MACHVLSCFLGGGGEPRLHFDDRTHHPADQSDLLSFSRTDPTDPTDPSDLLSFSRTDQSDQSNALHLGAVR